VRRRFAPHQLRHAHAVEMAREGVPLIVIRRQLGHSNLGITSVCLQASTTPRSSRRSTRAAPQWCRSPPRARTCRPRGTERCRTRARTSAPTPAGREPAHSSADAAQRQSQSFSHARRKRLVGLRKRISNGPAGAARAVSGIAWWAVSHGSSCSKPRVGPPALAPVATPAPAHRSRSSSVGRDRPGCAARRAPEHARSL
jgi:hypothetical protein